MHALTLGLNKSMRASDNEQGINKLWPKVAIGFSPDIMKDVFPLNENSYYNTRNERKFQSRHIRTVHFGSETLSHLAPKILELVPEIKKLESVAYFKNAIKKWQPTNCPCRLCQTYIFQVGFV